MSKFNYFLPGGIRQWSAINKHTTKLVYATVTYMETNASESSQRSMAQKQVKLCDKAQWFSCNGEGGLSVRDNRGKDAT